MIDAKELQVDLWRAQEDLEKARAELRDAYEAGAREMREQAAMEAKIWPGGGPAWSGAQANDTEARIRALPLHAAAQEGK